MQYMESLQFAYLVLAVPAAFGVIAQVFLGGGDAPSDTGFDCDVSGNSGDGTADLSGGDTDEAPPSNSGFHITVGMISNFFLGVGLSGYLTARWGILSLPVAVMGGLVFVWILGTFLRMLVTFSAREEKKAAVPSAQKGMECVATSTLMPKSTGSVDVIINGRTCGYFANVDVPVAPGTRCVVVSVDKNTVFVRPIVS